MESGVAGVALPKGASRVSDNGLTGGMGRMMAAGAKEFHIPEKSGGIGNAEVYFWTGENYKAGRARFMITMLESALNEKGYTVTKVDSYVDNIPNIFDEDKFATGSLDLGYGDPKPTFFHATNPQTRKTIVGMWLDQASKSRVVLALGEVGFAGVVSETKAPEVTGANVWLVKDLKNASKGMPTPPLPAFPKLSPKPGTVRGVVLNGGGKPIVGAKLIATSSAAGGFRTSFEARTNAQGIYEIPLPVGICQIVNADCHVMYNENDMVLPLHPADGVRDEFDSRPGHIENFVLRTSGSAGEGEGNYGAPVRVLAWHLPVRSVVEITLTPNGPLVDGSQGKTLVFRWNGPKGDVSMETFLGGIPLGRYKMTAKVFDGEDALPLRMRKITDDDYVAALDVKFEADNGKNASLGRSGAKQFDVTMEP